MALHSSSRDEAVTLERLFDSWVGFMWAKQKTTATIGTYAGASLVPWSRMRVMAVFAPGRFHEQAAKRVEAGNRREGGGGDGEWERRVKRGGERRCEVFVRALPHTHAFVDHTRPRLLVTFVLRSSCHGVCTRQTPCPFVLHAYPEHPFLLRHPYLRHASPATSQTQWQLQV